MDTNKLLGIFLKCDRDTITHSIRVMKRSSVAGELFGLSELEQQALYYGALFHDVGKQLIPKAILDKPGKLTEKEYRLVQQHPALGSALLKNLVPRKVNEIIRYHHERFDGCGYPNGLKGEDIPLLARIVSVIDAYDAIVSERHYNRVLSKRKAMDEIQRNLGTQFDPEIGETFLLNIGYANRLLMTGV